MRGFAIFIVAVFVLFFIGLSRIPDMLANNLSKKLGVPVSIDAVHLGTPGIEIENIEINNPKDYSLPKAFSAEEIGISIPITTLLNEEIVIDEVKVDNIYLGIEFDSKTSTRGNWTEILSNFHRQATPNEKSGKNILIKTLTFTNIRSEVLFRDSGGVQKLPLIGKITLTNISTKGGISTDQLTRTILAQMLKEVFTQQNMSKILEAIIKSPGKAVDTLLKPLEGSLFNAVDRKEDKSLA